MSDKYLLRHKSTDIPVGNLDVDIENDNFSFVLDSGYEGPLPSFLMYPPKTMSYSDSIRMWVMNRSPEPHYEFIDQAIKKAGLTEYDAYGFFKYNNGAFITDDFYVEPS